MAQEKKEADAACKSSDTPQPAHTPEAPTSPEKKETQTASKTGDKAAAESVAKAQAERKAREEQEMRKAQEEAPYIAIAQRYAGSYPNCPEFHITSDKMVFLAGDKAEAEAHQKTLGKGRLRTIKAK